MQRRYSDAETLHLQNLEDMEITRGFGEKAKNATQQALAATYFDQKKWERAEKTYRKILTHIETKTDKDILEFSRLRFEFARVLNALERYNEAEDLYLMALTPYTNIHGERHPFTLRRYRGLANLYREQGKYEKAIKTLNEALKLSEQAFGSEAIDTFKFRYDLAMIFKEQGMYREAQKNLEDILNIELANDPSKEEHPDILMFYNGLADLHWSKGEISEAVKLFKNVLKAEKRLGKKHPEIYKARESLEEIDKGERTSKNNRLRSKRGKFGKDNLGQKKTDSEESEMKEQKLHRIMERVSNDVLWYYEKINSDTNLEKVLKSMLRESDLSDDHQRKLNLARIYYKQERYLKIIRLYYTILDKANRGVLAERGEKISSIGIDKQLENERNLRILQLLSEAYYNLRPEKIDLEEVSVLIRRLIRDVEFDLGCAETEKIRRIKENMDKEYLLQKKYVDYSLRRNNNAIRTQFTIENFLEIREFRGTIVPITCIFGENVSGKTAIMKILHACQTWAYRGFQTIGDVDLWQNIGANISPESEDMDTKVRHFIEERRKGNSKDLFLSEEYKNLEREDRDIRDSVEISTLEEIDMLEEIDFFNNKLEEMIKYQILSIALYFVEGYDNTYNQREFWENVRSNHGENSETKITAENFFFYSEVIISHQERRKDMLNVTLRWKKIKRLTLKVKNYIAQLRLDVENDGVVDTFYYYILKREGKRTNEIVFNQKRRPSEILVNNMSMASIKTAILNILFESTPFVFFEGRSELFPAHRTGLCLSLSAGVKRHLYNNFLDCAEFIRFVEGESFVSLSQTEIYSSIYLNEDNNEDNDDYIDHTKISSKLVEAFSAIEQYNVEVIGEQWGNQDINMMFEKSGRRIKTHEVATSSLSLALLNIYVKQLTKILLRIRDKKMLYSLLETYPTMISYDEPEVSLHPDHIVKLLDFLFYMFQELREIDIPCNLVFITHSPLVLSWTVNRLLEKFLPEGVGACYSAIELSRDSGGLFVGREILTEEGTYKKNPYLDVTRRENEIRRNSYDVVEKTKKGKSKIKLYYQI